MRGYATSFSVRMFVLTFTSWMFVITAFTPEPSTFTISDQVASSSFLMTAYTRGAWPGSAWNQPDARTVEYRLYYQAGDQVYTDSVLHAFEVQSDGVVWNAPM